MVREKGQLKGAFRGFKNRDTEFQFYGGSKWRQAEYKYLYQYAYMPQAKVVDEDGRYMLYVEGVNEPVEVRPA
jgi:hypothetical protein